MRPEPHMDGIGCMAVLCFILMIVGAEFIDYKNKQGKRPVFIS